MALKDSLISQAVNKVKQSFQDNTGWFRGGKFTPVQQYKDIQTQSPIRSFGPLTVPNLKNPQIKQIYSSVNTPEKQIQFNQQPVKGFGQNLNSYVMNRYIAPISQVPYRAKQIVKGKTIGEKVQGGLGLLGGTIAMIPDPIGDIALPVYDYIKGVTAAQKAGESTLKSYKTGISSLTGQTQTGLGTAFGKTPTQEKIGNIAELPLMFAITGKIGKTKANRQMILNAASEIDKYSTLAKNYNRLRPEIQMSVIENISRLAKKVIPQVVNNKEMKKVSLRDPQTWLKYTSNYLDDAVMNARHPELHFGFNTRTIKRPSQISPESVSKVEGDINSFLKNKFGSDTKIYDENLGSRIIKLPNDNIRYSIKEDGNQIRLYKIIADKQNTGAGTDFVNSLKEYADKTGKEIVVIQPTSKFWGKFDWLKNNDNNARGDLSFNPKNLSPESKGIIPKTETVLPKGKIKTTLSKIEEVTPTTKESQISAPQLSISKKGKLNTDKLNITPEQKVAIDQLQDNVPVTVIGNKDVIEKSKLTTGAKRAMTDEEMKNRLASQLNSRQEVVSLSKQFEKLKQQGASEAELTALKSKIIDQSRIAQQEGTLAGRQLQARNILANEMATPEQKIYAMLDNAGIDQKTYIKDAINVDFNDATQAINFYRKYIPASFKEILDEVRYTNMLSSPLTQIVNTFSNVIQSGIVKPIEKTLTGQLDWISSKLTGKERKYFASQGIDYAKGYYSALPDAFKKFKNIVSGKEMSIRPDLEHIPTATKGALKWYSTPLRTLEATDQFFRTLVQSGEKKSLARLNLPEKEIAKRAAESADYTLFRQKFDPSGELGQGTILKAWDKWNSAIQNLRRVPGGNWILPFIQTPTNILKQGFEYSPLGFSTMIGAKRPLEQLSKAMIGTGAFLSLYGIADKGGTTWDVPVNTKEKELFYAAGLQPYSVKIGNKWVSYSKLGPLAYPLAMASALKWVEKNNPDQNLIENLQGALGEMLGFFGDQSYVSSIGDFINTMKGGYGVKKAVSGEITNLVSQMIPYKSFQGWLTRLIDPTYRKPEGMMQTIQSQTPGLSTGVPAYKDIYGQESKRDMPLVNAVSPLRISTEKPEAAKLLQQQQEFNIEKAKVKKEGEAMGLDEAKSEVETGGQAQMVGNNIIYYDDGVKTIDLTKYDQIAKMPATNKYETALKESKQFSTAATLLDKAGLTEEQKTTALKRLGIDEGMAKYYQIANDNTNLKTMYVMDQVSSAQTTQEVIAKLSKMRTQVNGQMIASNAVLDNLVDEGILTKLQATEIKKYKYEEGQLKKLKAATGAKAKKISIKKPALKKIKVKAIKLKKIKTKQFKVQKLKAPKKLKVKKFANKKQ